jgi:hypothetical protein
MDMSNQNFKNKYLLYKSKYLKLKQQLGGRDVNVYSKTDSKIQYKVDLEPEDDINTFKNRVLAQSADKSFGFNSIEVYSYDKKSNKCTGLKKTNIEQTDNDLCININKLSEKKFVPIKIKTGHEIADIPIINFEGKIELPELFFEGKIKSGVKNSNGYLYLEDAEGELIVDGLYVKGTFKNNKLNGQGIELFSDGEVYEGAWVDGQLTGIGRMKTANGIEITGLFNNFDIIEGKIAYPNGRVENGKFVNRELVDGKIIHPNGDIFEGTFDDYWLVQGKKTFSDGDIYEGEWNKKQFINGTYKNKSGYEASGTWVDFMLTKGEIKYPNDRIENGDFTNEILRKGKILFLKSKEVHEGEFSNGKLHGKGTIRNLKNISLQDNAKQGEINFTNSLIIKGEFAQGEIISGEKLEGDFIKWKLVKGKKTIYPSNEVHEGNFSDGKLYGPGKITKSNGSIIEGDFSNGSLVKGSITTGNLDVKFEGTFKNNKLEGPGKITSKKSKIIEGRFSNGEIISGSITHRSGKVETGTFSNGKLIAGTIKLPNGTINKI